MSGSPITCLFCGKAIQPEWQVCPNCAMPIPERKPEAVEASRREDAAEISHRDLELTTNAGKFPRWDPALLCALASFIPYCISLSMTACLDLPGYYVLVLGWLGVFDGVWAWFANPFYAVGLILLARYLFVEAAVSLSIALILAASSFGIASLTMSGSGRASTFHLGAGFAFWFLAIVIATGSSILLACNGVGDRPKTAKSPIFRNPFLGPNKARIQGSPNLRSRSTPIIPTDDPVINMLTGCAFGAFRAIATIALVGIALVIAVFTTCAVLLGSSR